MYLLLFILSMKNHSLKFFEIDSLKTILLYIFLNESLVNSKYKYLNIMFLNSELFKRITKLQTCLENNF